MVFDCVIKNAEIINGLNEKRFPGELGISGELIAAVTGRGGLAGVDAREVIDCGGCSVAPGFIDIHSHDDRVFWDDPFNQAKLRQGVTTVVTGMCGTSPFPLPEPEGALLAEIKKSNPGSYPWTARSLSEYAEELMSLGPALNVIPVVGHRALRMAVMGYEKRGPTHDEMDEMKDLLGDALAAGARGMSTGLIYPPCSYASTDEITGLASVLSEYGGIYFTHLRSESLGMPAALKEAFAICADSGTPLHIAHFKCLGRDSWGRAGERLSLIEAEMEKGLRVSWDQYPYTACSTGLLSLLPPESQSNGVGMLIKELGVRSFREGLVTAMQEASGSWQNFFHQAGGWEKIVLSSAPGCEELEGRSIPEISDFFSSDPFSTVFDLLRKTSGAAKMVVFSMSEEDVEQIMCHPLTSVGSDGLPGKGKIHPRNHGTFARVLGRYSRAKKLFSVEEAVYKMTSLPARILGIRDRGAVKEGYKADLAIFDTERIVDAASYTNPLCYPEGIHHVFVGGRRALSGGVFSGCRAGGIIKAGG